MVYQWKIPLKVPVNEAAAELERIFNERGEIAPETVVEESRPEGAVLHGLFEWDDAKAAEKYRISQARFIIRNITTEQETEEGPVTVRGFHVAEHNYAPTAFVMSSEDLRNKLLESALAELEQFKAKYHALTALARVFEAIEEVGAA